MNKKFAEKLNEFLQSQCSEYSFGWDRSWNDDYSHCKIEITNIERTVGLIFKFQKTMPLLNISGY